MDNNNKIKSFENKLNVLKNEYINSYALYLNNKNINSYLENYDKVDSKITKSFNDLFIIENNLLNETDDKKNKLKDIEKDIVEIKKQIGEKEQRLSTLLSKDNSAVQLYEDKIDIYNNIFFNLIIYFLGSIGMIFFGYKKYKQNI